MVWRCNNCGIEKKSLFASFGDLFFDYPRDFSLKNYKIRRKLFCSRRCYEEYNSGYLRHMEKMSSLKGVWKFRMYLIVRNPIVIAAIVISLAFIGVIIYLITKYTSSAPGGLFLAIPLMLFFLWYLSWLITHPWKFPFAY